jgi:hypothetical protein
MITMYLRLNWCTNTLLEYAESQAKICISEHVGNLSESILNALFWTHYSERTFMKSPESEAKISEPAYLNSWDLCLTSLGLSNRFEAKRFDLGNVSFKSDSKNEYFLIWLKLWFRNRKPNGIIHFVENVNYANTAIQNSY